MSGKAGTVDEHQLAVALTFDFEYDSSQFAADRPYWIEENGKRTNLVEISIAVELTDSCHFMFLFQPIVLPELSTASKIEKIWCEDFDGAYEEGGDTCFIMTMHPQIIGCHHRLQMVERFICYMLEHDSVWFAQLGDIADDFRKWEK